MDNLNHILVVDDDDRIRNLLKEYLNDNNFIVSTAQNSEDAKTKPALTILLSANAEYDIASSIKFELPIDILILFITSFFTRDKYSDCIVDL